MYYKPNQASCMRPINRRKFLQGTAAGAGLSVAGCLGSGSGEYPSDDITLIIPFAEGGGTDTAMRNIMPTVSEELGVNVVIENIPGSASLRGAGEAFNADPDGYTMLAFNPPSTPISALVHQPGFDLRKLTGIGAYGRSPYTMVANPKHEFTGLPDVVDRFKDGEFDSVAGQARGGPLHVLSVLIQGWLPWKNYLPYDGSGEILQAVMGGEAPIGFPTPAEVADPVENGQLDFICYMSSEGTSAFPDADTITDHGYDSIDFVAQLTRTLWFPPETPDEQVNTMFSALETAMQSDKVTNWAEQSGFFIDVAGPDAAEQVLADIYETVPQKVDLEKFRS